MSKTGLLNELVDAQAGKKTGKVQVIGTLGGSSKSASIDVFEGAVVNLRFGSDSGAVALKSIGDMSVSRAVFMKSAGIEPSAAPGTPDMQAVIDSVSGTTAAEGAVVDSSLIDRVADVMRPVFGKGQTRNRVVAIADKFPPSDNLALFLQKCQTEAEMIVGDAQAAQMFVGFGGAAGGASAAGGHFIEEATRILSSVLGPKAGDRVAAIAKENPPQQNPGQFIAACVSLAEPMMGKAGAEKLFDKLKG